ncbi:MAG TPA: ribosome silencing factor [Treponema sp.]|nr:ribosome silencing factor [Treponema sp.]
MSVETKTQGFAGKETALALGGILRDHKGDNSLVIDLREMNAWTDFFVIATASSNTHLDGLERHVREFCAGENIEVLRRSRRPSTSDDEWRLLDLGAVVVHLMSANARSFYELERLYPPPHAKIISEQKQSE